MYGRTERTGKSNGSDEKRRGMEVREERRARFPGTVRCLVMGSEGNKVREEAMCGVKRGEHWVDRC